MLNPLYLLTQTLQNEGLLQKAKDSSVVVVKNPTIFWAGVEEENFEASIQENSGNLLKFQPSNQNSWPCINMVVNLPAPLPKFDRKDETDKRAKVCRELFNTHLEAITDSINQIPQDALKRAKRVQNLLPEKSLLRKSAQEIQELLSIPKNQEQLAQKITKCIFERLDALDSKEQLKFIKAIFAFKDEVKTSKLPLVIGRILEKNALLNGNIVEALSQDLAKPANTTSNSNLFQDGGDRPVLSGYPLMASRYYPVSRPNDFPALHGYFGGGFASISSQAMDEIRSALDYLLDPAKRGKTFREFSISKQTYLLIAIPNTPNEENQKLSSQILDLAQTNPFKKEGDILEKEMEFEASAFQTLNPEETSENIENLIPISLLVLTSPMRANIQVYLNANKSFGDWKTHFKAWETDQFLPGEYTLITGSSKKTIAGIFNLPETLGVAYKTDKKSFASYADKTSPQSKGGNVKEILESPTLALNTLHKLQTTLLRQIPTQVVKVLSERELNREKKNPIAIFDLNRSLGTLVLTINRIQSLMALETTEKAPAFLLGQALNQLNKLEESYRQVGQERRKENIKSRAVPKGSKLLAIAERPNIALSVANILRGAQPYLTKSIQILRNKSSEKEPTKAEKALTHHARVLRETIQEIQEKTLDFTLVPKSRIEIQQHCALVRIGILSKPKYIPKDCSNTEPLKERDKDTKAKDNP